MINADVEIIQDTDEATRALRKMIERARGRKWLHVVLMLLWAVLALATTAWFLIPVAFHWALASFYEQLDPHLAKRIRDDRERWSTTLRREAASHNVIQAMKDEIWHRRNPWARAVVAWNTMPYTVWALIRRDTK